VFAWPDHNVNSVSLLVFALSIHIHAIEYFVIIYVNPRLKQEIVQI